MTTSSVHIQIFKEYIIAADKKFACKLNDVTCFKLLLLIECQSKPKGHCYIHYTP